MNHFENFDSYIPVDLTQPVWFAAAVVVSYGFIVARYFLLVGLFYFCFWKRKSQWLSKRQIYQTLPGGDQIFSEIKWSLATSGVFAVTGVFVGAFWQKGYSQIYLDLTKFGYWYLPVSLILMMGIHELYFYLSHRWMHKPRWFSRIHYIHHQSLQPSPWASFSFHPLEACIEALILPLLIFLIPVHPVVFIAYLTLMTVSAAINHLGFEIWLGSRFFITGTHHSHHHRHYRSNFGLYFTFLDRVFQTEFKGSKLQP